MVSGSRPGPDKKSPLQNPGAPIKKPAGNGRFLFSGEFAASGVTSFGNVLETRAAPAMPGQLLAELALRALGQ